MKYLRIFFSLLIIWLSGCEIENDKEAGVAVLQPGTPAHFYELGLATSDPAEKLEYYNAGLERVENPRDTNLVALLEGKVFAMNLTGKMEETEVWIDSLIKIAELQNDDYFQAKGLYRKSVLNRFRSNPEGVYEYAFLSKKVYLKMGDSAMAARRSLDMANAQQELGDLTGAQESATEAIKHLDREVDPHLLSPAFNVVGLSYMGLGFHEDARKEFENALKHTDSPKDSLSYLHNIAIVYKNEGKYEEALKIFEEIIKSSEPDTESRNRFLDNYYYTKWLRDSTENVEEELLDVVEKRLEDNDREGLITSYGHLSEYFEGTDPARSKAYAEAMLREAKTVSSSSSEVNALNKLIALSDGREKENYLERYLSLRDSLQEVSLRSKAHFAKVKFDEERKEQQINLLEAENESQSLRTEKLQNRTLVISLAALLTLLFAVGLLYYFKQRAKKEKLREIYLTERRISKRIHDELANDIYNVMSTLEAVAPVAVVDRLEKIYHRTREFSRENNEIDTGDRYVEDMLSMLSHATPATVKLIVRGEQEINWTRLEPEKKIVLYRVLQEIMVNMKKHSEASLVALIFSTEKKLLKINYSDNGKGTTETAINTGNGVRNIRMRLKTVYGKATFDTSGKGLKAEICLPISS